MIKAILNCDLIINRLTSLATLVNLKAYASFILWVIKWMY